MSDFKYIKELEEDKPLYKSGTDTNYDIGRQIVNARDKAANEGLTPYVDPIELAREKMKKWVPLRDKAIEEGLATIDGDFYVIIVTKQERLFSEVMSTLFVTARACPSRS